MEPPIVNPPRIELNQKEKALFMLEDKVEKIEASLKRKNKREVWFNILYSVIGAVVGGFITFLLTKIFQ